MFLHKLRREIWPLITNLCCVALLVMTGCPLALKQNTSKPSCRPHWGSAREVTGCGLGDPSSPGLSEQSKNKISHSLLYDENLA
jgi:hypothetical protein